MAKVMAMTVHVRDDREREHVFNAGEELPAWAEKVMREGGHEDDSPAWTEAPPAGEPEKVSQAQHLAEGHPTADRSGAADEDAVNEDATGVVGELHEKETAENRKLGGFEEDGSEPEEKPKAGPAKAAKGK